MRIHDMFERDIDRDINGVIKIDQADEAVIEQELSEYVVTRELRGHFSTFFDAYERAIDEPTGKIGVWISGFFGSGKSHFLKMLSYLLSDRTVGGRRALDYIEPRFEDEMIAAKARRAAGIPTETILFNIGSKSSDRNDASAVIRTFYRVFYENQGFYGASPKLARLEALIEAEGLTDAFRQAYEQASGHSWLDWRKTYQSKSAPVIEALAACGFQTREEAERWYASDDLDISADTFTDEVRDYAERRAAEHGGRFRLLFMVDEVSQYVGEDTDRMNDLQNIVEGLGTKCAGRVWVVVTGQEAIDEITTVAGSDFSKIQGRFNTRLSLSSSDANEVIKRRVLSKTPDAAQLLELRYGQDETVLRNLFTFGDAKADLMGYRDAIDFAQTFPFVNYQFTLLQNVMNALRNQGHSGKHLSSGERSMLSGFQEAAQAVEELDEHALVPFWRFYDATESFLEHYHRQVINRAARQAEAGQGLEGYDVRVLKLLFLIRWVDRDVAATVDNIVTLMTDDVRENRLELRERVQASLDRLMKESYITRNGDRYQFLTDDEQEIANQIARTHVDSETVTKKAADIVFKDIFDTPKLTVGVNQFPVEEYLDQTPVGSPGGLILRVIAGMDGSEPPTHEELILQSGRGEAIVVLCPEIDYYGQLMEAARIEKYVSTVVTANLEPSQRDIVRGKQQEKTRLEKEASGLIEEAVRRGELYVQGNAVTPAKTSSAKKRIEEALARLVDTVYPKLACIDRNYTDDAGIRRILNGTEQALPGQQPNARAIEELERKLKTEAARHRTVTMGDIQRQYQAAPYGWREADIAAVAAELLASRRAKLTYAGKAVDLQDGKCVNYLRMRSMVDKVQIEMRRTASDAERATARRTVEELCRVHDLPVDEEGLARRIREALQERRDGLQRLLDVEYRRNRDYPGYSTVADTVALLDELLKVDPDPVELLGAVVRREDDLLDAAEDLESVDDFFPDRQRIFDSATDLLKQVGADREDLEADAEAAEALGVIESVLADRNIHRRIPELSPAVQQVKAVRDRMLKAKRTDLLEQVDVTIDELAAYARERDVKLSEIEKTRLLRRDTANSAATLTELDALRTRLEKDQRRLSDEIDREYDRINRPRPAMPGVTITTDHTPPAGASAQGAGTQMPASGTGAAASGAGSASRPAPVTAPDPKVVTIERSRVFRPRRLRSAQEVDDYLEAARTQLLDALKDNDSVKLN